jgi:hypothetical protein
MTTLNLYTIKRIHRAAPHTEEWITDAFPSARTEEWRCEWESTPIRVEVFTDPVAFDEIKNLHDEYMYYKIRLNTVEPDPME